MRTPQEAASNPRRGDAWRTKILRRTVLGKRYGAVIVETSGGGRATTIESIELQYFERWAGKATRVKP